MTEKKNYDENGAERRSPFKPKSASSIEGNEVEDFIKSAPRKDDNKTINPEVKPKRVKDLLKSFSKFDEDIMRLQGGGNTNSEDDDSINELSIEEMQNELQGYLLERDRIKINLDNLVVRVNKTSHELEHEEEKIKKLSQEIELHSKKSSFYLEDD